ncbi:MAG: S-methyl-5-thioribose-1-phosphate isomerase [Bacteroidales bacterium]
MLVEGKPYRTVWFEEGVIKIINQNRLPFRFEVLTLPNVEAACEAIVKMHVRGAGAIGAVAGYAMALAFKLNGREIHQAREDKRKIESTRPTARNLFYAVEKVWEAGLKGGYQHALNTAEALSEENVKEALAIAEFGEKLIPDGAHIMTHCNAGWLGFVDWGSALAPLFLAHRKGKKIHVYVSETRPRLQGARLTAWELTNEGIPYEIFPDGASAYLMQQKKVDAIITGADRIALNGDTANKIGTLDKAISARHYNIPFYVAAPLATFDFKCPNGSSITIEYRAEEEVLSIQGVDIQNRLQTLRIAPPHANALNPAFDVTPAPFIHTFITSRGLIKPYEIQKIANLAP